MIPNPSRLRLALGLVVLALCAGPVRAGGPAEDLYGRTLRCTALVLTRTGSGSGWIIDLDQRLLVTNEHVVTTQEQVEVVFPLYGQDGKPLAEWAHYARHGRSVRAEVIDVDGRRDLALVRLLEPPPDGVTALKLAAREPRPSERVHSVGNPSASGALWLYSTGTVRQVYHKEWRFADGQLRAARVVETQSPINPGDSGGPVVNDAGELVAVVSGRTTDAALMSYAIATAEVRAFVAEARPLVEPQTADAFQRRGMRALQRGHIARALDDLNEAHRLQPKSADVLADRAQVHRARKDYDLALDDCHEALRLAPQHAEAYNVRGCVQLDQGKPDEALKAFRKAIQLAPRRALYHANRAYVHAEKKEFEPAIRSYDEALRLGPPEADWYYHRGLALEQHGNRDRAEADFREAVRLDPSYRERVILHHDRYLQVANKSGQKLRVHLRYEAQTADGQWAWLPAKGSLMWEVAPAATVQLLHDGQRVQARRLRIWADGMETSATWHAVKDQDTWTAPANGYRGGAQPGVFTYSFTP
jgi:tetratricopeptide (TPR) repeat protein